MADEDIIRELTEYWKQVLVPDCVLSEVGQLSEERAEELGLILVETPLTGLVSLPSLSYQDRTCLFYTEQYSAVCLTNDEALRKACEARGASTFRGLRMLLFLVENQQIKKSRARGIAERIHSNNPEITDRILDDFLKNLKT